MRKNQKGQTLVALLFFIMIGIIATGATTIMLFTNLISAQKLEVAETVRQMAEAGGEEALILLLRDSTYLGETLTIDEGSVEIEVNGTTTKTIESTATQGNISRKIVITATLINNVLTVTDWQSVY